MQTNRVGMAIIQELGTSPYILWSYLESKNFITPTIEEMANDLGRNRRTIKGWIKKLEEKGYLSVQKARIYNK